MTRSGNVSLTGIISLMTKGKSEEELSEQLSDKLEYLDSITPKDSGDEEWAWFLATFHIPTTHKCVEGMWGEDGKAEDDEDLSLAYTEDDINEALSGFKGASFYSYGAEFYY